MPAAVPVLVATVAAAGVQSAIISAGILIAGSLMSSVIAKSMADKPRRRDHKRKTAPIQVNSIRAMDHIPLFFGSGRLGGVEVLPAFTSDETGDGSNESFWKVIAHTLASPAGVENLGALWLNGQRITQAQIDGSGFVTHEDWLDADGNSMVQITSFDGTDTQAAHTPLVNAHDDWTTAHQGKGIAYTVARFIRPTGEENEQAFQKAFGGRPPTVTREILGNKCYDPRKDDTRGGSGLHRTNDPSTWEWSDNPALIKVTYMIMEERDFGLGIDPATINMDTVAAAASRSEEQFTDADSISRNRFTANIAIDSPNPDDNLDALDTADAGISGYDALAGEWFAHAGQHDASVATIDENWTRGAYTWTTRSELGELRNAAKVNYVNPDLDYKEVTCLLRENSTYEAQDGGEQLIEELEAPAADNEQRAQYLGKIFVERSREQQILAVPCNMKALQLAFWDAVTVSFPDFAGTFRVINWQWSGDGFPDLLLREIISTTYDVSQSDLTSRSFPIKPGREDEKPPKANIVSLTKRPEGVLVQVDPIGRTRYAYLEMLRALPYSNAVDTSSNNNNGSLVDDPTWVSDGPNGELETSLEFNGTSQYVSVPDASALDITGAITIEAWVYLDTRRTDIYDIIMAKGKSLASTADAYAIWAWRGGLESQGVAFRLSIGGTSNTVSSNETPPIRTWFHVAATYDGTTMRIYIDGVLKNSASASGSIDTTSNPLRFAHDGTTDNYQNGRLSDCRLWNVTRSGTEISDNKDSRLEGTESGLVGYWQLGVMSNEDTRRKFADPTFLDSINVEGDRFYQVRYVSDFGTAGPWSDPDNVQSRPVSGTGVNLIPMRYSSFQERKLPPLELLTTGGAAGSIQQTTLHNRIGDTALRVNITPSDEADRVVLNLTPESGGGAPHNGTNIKVEPGEDYILSFWFTPQQDRLLEVFVRGVHEGNNTLDQGPIGLIDFNDTDDGEQKRYAFAFTNDAGNERLYLQFEIQKFFFDAFNDAYGVFDGFMLEKRIGNGASASGYAHPSGAPGEDSVAARDGQMVDRRDFFMVGTGNRNSVQTNFTGDLLTGTDVPGDGADIDMKAHDLVIGDLTLSYGSATVSVNNNTEYHVYLDDPDFTGDASPSINATTNADTVVSQNGRYYIGTITTPTDGGGGTGGGGGGGCVSCDMLVGDIPAGELKLGDMVRVADEFEEKGWATIEGLKLDKAPCLELVCDNGWRLECTEDTPFTLPDLSTRYAPDMLGESVLLEGGSTAIVERISSIGVKLIARISVGGMSFAAGEDGRMIYSHNQLKQ